MADENTAIPDIYSDRFNLFVDALGVSLLLSRVDPITSTEGIVGKTTNKPVAILRFTPENWKVIMMVGRKQLKAQELSNGAVLKLPQALFESLKVSEADW